MWLWVVVCVRMCITLGRFRRGAFPTCPHEFCVQKKECLCVSICGSVFFPPFFVTLCRILYKPGRFYLPANEICVQDTMCVCVCGCVSVCVCVYVFLCNYADSCITRVFPTCPHVTCVCTRESLGVCGCVFLVCVFFGGCYTRQNSVKRMSFLRAYN